MLNNLLLGQTAEEKLYVEDVFSTYLYSGTSASQTVTNGIDLAGKGGLVWIKNRTGGGNYHGLFDTDRGTGRYLQSQSTSASSYDPNELTAFNSNGFSLGSSPSIFLTNNSSMTYASWTFRKAPKFFDCVTWTGNNTSGRQISHSLGVTPGMIIIKNITGGTYWAVWHRSIGATDYLSLNTTDAASTLSSVFNAAPTSTYFQVGNSWWVNGDSSNQYVAYLFAHDTTADGVIQCGSYTGTSASNPINLGWEPQFLLIKRTDGVASWYIQDVMRDMSQTNTRTLSPNTSSAEYNNAGPIVFPTATGFDFASGGYSGWNQSGFSYIYLAIRRGPMRVPTDATKVFSINTRTGTGSTSTFDTSITPDIIINKNRTPYGDNTLLISRLTGKLLYSSTTSAEATSEFSFVGQTSVTVTGADGRSNQLTSGPFSYVLYNIRRSVGFFDVVCYTGTGSASTVSHNLGVAPELMIVKDRSSTNAWFVYSSFLTATKRLLLNTNAAAVVSSVPFNNTEPTATNFMVGGNTFVNASGSGYVAYLFASCPGVSKVGSYTGNGSSQNINCGFTNGARFVLIKRTDDVSDWYVWDTARGIVAANDPIIALNTIGSEGTGLDSIDPLSTGFTVNQDALSVNVSGGTYIYLAIA